jgi:hypothetical protein
MNIQFTLVTVETSSMMTNILMKNHYMLRPHRPLLDDSLIRILLKGRVVYDTLIIKFLVSAYYTILYYIGARGSAVG